MVKPTQLAAWIMMWALLVGPQVSADDVPAKPVDGAIRWLYDYEAGKQLARDTGKPMFVVFRCER
jgi:hypothetical protein